MGGKAGPQQQHLAAVPDWVRPGWDRYFRTPFHSIDTGCLFQIGVNSLQRIGDSRRVLTPGCGKKRLAPTAALDVFPQFPDNLPGIQLALIGQLLGDIATK